TGMFFLLLMAITFFQLFSIVPVFYKEAVQLTELTIGIVLASNGLLIVAVEMILVYKLEKKGEPILYIVYGAFLIGLSFLVLAIAPLLSFVLLGMLVVTFGEMLLFPFTNDFWVSRTNAHNRGQYAAVYTMTFALAHVLAPLLSSRVAVWVGYRGLFIIDFLVCCVAASGFIWLRSQLKKNGQLQQASTGQMV
ncbi:MAG: MFS transporter, partial [Chitinophagaceae bacterium]